MPDDAHKPSLAERPRLVDFLIVAEHRVLDIGLRMWVGAIEVGLVGTSAGRVVFAELPGATGDAALQLLASLTEARVVPETWTTRVTNVESHWRRLISEGVPASGGRGPRLAAAREALRDWIDGDGESYEADEPNSRAMRLAIELLDWAAITAYLAHDLARAERLLERRKAIGAADAVCRANLERLRLRRLDEELDSTLGAGGGE